MKGETLSDPPVHHPAQELRTHPLISRFLVCRLFVWIWGDELGLDKEGRLCKWSNR